MRCQISLFLLLLLSFFSCKKEFINTIYVKQIHSDAKETFNDIHFPSANTGYVACANSVLLKTTDGGTNWTSIKIDTILNNLTAVYFRNEMQGLIIKNGTVFLFSYNGGNTWTSDPNSVNDSILKDYKKIHPQNEDEFYTDTLHGYKFNYGSLAESGNISLTADGGKTWNKKFTGQRNDIKDLSFISSSVGFGVGDRTIIKTPDAGNSWMIIRNEKGESPPSMKKISAVSESLIFALTRNEIYKISATK